MVSCVRGTPVGSYGEVFSSKRAALEWAGFNLNGSIFVIEAETSFWSWAFKMFRSTRTYVLDPMAPIAKINARTSVSEHPSTRLVAVVVFLHTKRASLRQEFSE